METDSRGSTDSAGGSARGLGGVTRMGAFANATFLRIEQFFYVSLGLMLAIAALLGIAFKNILYKTEDICDRAWKNRPEWARPAVGGILLGLLLLAIPQLYGVGYPVMYKAVGGSYALWFLIVLAAGKIIACSLTIGIGGSGGVFAPSLFIGATSGMAFGEIAGHLLGPAAGQPALYAVVAMGAVFASAARAPLTAVASVVEMTGDYTLTLPVMLAVAIATAIAFSKAWRVWIFRGVKSSQTIPTMRRPHSELIRM